VSTAKLCVNGCNRPSRLFGSYCSPCLRGEVPETDPKLCSNDYLTKCALELIQRGCLNAPLVEAAQEAARNLGSTQ
jgi:hypothetical protein